MAIFSFLWHHPNARIGLTLLLLIVLLSAVGPLLSPYGEYDICYLQDGRELSAEQTDFSRPDVTILSRAAPSLRHPLGTDKDGRDILTRLMYGGRVSLLIAAVVTCIEICFGALIGGIAGGIGGITDSVLMRIVDVFCCLPTLPILLIVSSAMLTSGLPQNSKMYIFMLALGLLGWAGIAKSVRGLIVSLREREYILAARAAGVRFFSILRRHLLPGTFSQLAVLASLGAGNVILTESSLSFLGLGLPTPYASWGNMISVIHDADILRGYPHIWLPPGLCILITVAALNLLGDGLRDYLNKK